MNFKDFLNRESKEDYYVSLMNFLDNEYKEHVVYPKRDDIFNAFKLCDLDKTKVIILGQDPYHEENQAMGLAFSVPSNIKIPPSLRNIYKELESDTNELVIKDGDLTSWAKQGVLLLNTVLTVRKGEANSHKNKGWEIFTNNIIKVLNEDNTPKVFILWGDPSIKKKELITNPNHLVLTSSHPSPLSAYRDFFGSKPFSKTNKFLSKNGIEKINWLI